MLAEHFARFLRLCRDPAWVPHVRAALAEESRVAAPPQQATRALLMQLVLRAAIEAHEPVRLPAGSLLDPPLEAAKVAAYVA